MRPYKAFLSVAPSFANMKLQDDPTLLIQSGIDVVRRSWRERLFSRPWQPLLATKIVKGYRPDPRYYVVNNNTIVAHPSTMAELRRAMAELEGGRP